MKKVLGFKGHEIVEATAATVLLAACVHLAVAVVSSLATWTIDYINPIDFLGFGLVAPSLLHSKIATFLAWSLLIGTGYVILRIHTHLRITISVKHPKHHVEQHDVLEADTTVE